MSLLSGLCVLLFKWNQCTIDIQQVIAFHSIKANLCESITVAHQLRCKHFFQSIYIFSVVFVVVLILKSIKSMLLWIFITLNCLMFFFFVLVHSFLCSIVQLINWIHYLNPMTKFSHSFIDDLSIHIVFVFLFHLF